MNGLKYFSLGFLFMYVIQIFDIIMNIINSRSAVFVTKCQAEINRLGGGEEIQDPYCIGFQAPSSDEYEIDGDYYDKANKNKKI